MTTTVNTANLQISFEKVLVLFFSLTFLVLFANAQPLNDVLRIEVTGNNFTDETIVRFLDNATEGFDNDFDAFKMFSFVKEVPQIYSVVNGTDEFAINALPSLTSEVLVDLNLKVGVSGNYQISLNFADFNNSATIIIEDKVKNAFVNLNQNASYTVEMNVDENTNRFILHIIPAQTLSNGTSFSTEDTKSDETNTTVINEANNDYRIYNVNNNIVIKGISGEVTVYNISGSVVAKGMIDKNEGQISVSGSGYFVAVVVDGGQIYSQKVVIK